MPLQHLLVPVDFEVGMQASLHQDTGAAEFDGLANFFVDGVEVEDVALFGGGTLERAIERAEGAVFGTEIRVINIAIDDVGDGAFGMQAAADGVGFHADSDEVVGVEQVEGLLFGQRHYYPTPYFSEGRPLEASFSRYPGAHPRV